MDEPDLGVGGRPSSVCIWKARRAVTGGTAAPELCVGGGRPWWRTPDIGFALPVLVQEGAEQSTRSAKRRHDSWVGGRQARAIVLALLAFQRSSTHATRLKRFGSGRDRTKADSGHSWISAATSDSDEPPRPETRLQVAAGVQVRVRSFPRSDC